jgi:hypothetical protein
LAPAVVGGRSSAAANLSCRVAGKSHSPATSPVSAQPSVIPAIDFASTSVYNGTVVLSACSQAQDGNQEVLRLFRQNQDRPNALLKKPSGCCSALLVSVSCHTDAASSDFKIRASGAQAVCSLLTDTNCEPGRMRPLLTSRTTHLPPTRAEIPAAVTGTAQAVGGVDPLHLYQTNHHANMPLSIPV